MKKTNLFLLIITFTILSINLIYADEKLPLVCGGDDELLIPCQVSDDQLNPLPKLEEEITQTKESGTLPKKRTDLTLITENLEYIIPSILILFGGAFFIIVYKRKKDDEYPYFRQP